MKKLEGRGAVVTGAGRGIGAAIAKALCKAGANVVLSARSEAEIDELAAELRAAGHRATALRCDVADPDSVAGLAGAAIAALDTVDILVNNAGTASSAPLARLTLQEWDRLMAVNATGTFLCSQAFCPGMVERGWGRVVNIASVAARSGAPYISAYAASKHAVLGFTRSIAAELGDRGVTVNALCPGFVDTPMTQATIANVQSKTGLGASEALAKVLGSSGQRRLVRPEEVAHQVLALCHNDAASVNGQAIVIDGGGLCA